MLVASRADALRQSLLRLNAVDPGYATQFVDELLAAATELGTSDVHVQPTGDGLDVRWRLDGVLQTVGVFPRGEAADIVARLKVLAELLTYRTDVPQEGRIRRPASSVEMRVSTFPTLHGERAVVRLFAGGGGFSYLEDLGLPTEIHASLRELLAETSGALLITGPAGSGKTTTAYAALREVVRTAGCQKSIVSLEDPIEVAVDGVAQSQVQVSAGFDFLTGLRSLMRQDPEVIFVGEIRDRITAETAFQASLTGHLVQTTFHAAAPPGLSAACLTWAWNPTCSAVAFSGFSASGSCGGCVIALVLPRMPPSCSGCRSAARRSPSAARNARGSAIEGGWSWPSC